MLEQQVRSVRGYTVTARELARKHSVDVPSGPHRCGYSKAYNSVGHRWYNDVKQWKYPYWIFDDDGYVIFSSEKHLRSSPEITITSGSVHAHQGIARISGYVRFRTAKD